MSGRWSAMAGALNEVAAPATSGLPSQASAMAVVAAHDDVAAFRTALLAHLRNQACHVAAADGGYVATESRSATELAAVVV
ncbi:hypothetical protein A9W95_22145 [Mycobacterium sp. 1423905.2]|nr:hypothetical protein A9W95_22145 [Mycobacterium sp. 1423905.2]